jgi:uncharacterized protein
MHIIGLTTVTTVVDSKTYDSEIDTILIKVASRCNINCTYCYVYHMGDDNWSRQSKFMSEQTIESMCQQLYHLSNAQQKLFSIVLHGGEPFLLGVARLKSLLKKLRNVLSSEYPISIQSNGILISNEILDICSEFGASVAVSIDGPREIHDKVRVGHHSEGTFDAVIRGIELLQRHKNSGFLNAGLLAVIDPASNPSEIYHFFKTLSAPSVDFLYKDGNLDRLPTGKKSIKSVEYGEWMTGLLKVYLSDPEPLPIRIIDDMMKVLLGGLSSKEGLGVTDFGIIIIDTDGTIMKNDTLKSSYNGADKFESPVNIKDMNLLDFLGSSAFSEYRQMQRPKNKNCLSCPNLTLCGGGMILHRWSTSNGFNNPSVYCSDQMYFIDNMKTALKAILQPHV